jgi:hypothetical protein
MRHAAQGVQQSFSMALVPPGNKSANLAIIDGFSKTRSERRNP